MTKLFPILLIACLMACSKDDKNEQVSPKNIINPPSWTQGVWYWYERAFDEIEHNVIITDKNIVEKHIGGALVVDYLGELDKEKIVFTETILSEQIYEFVVNDLSSKMTFKNKYENIGQDSIKLSKWKKEASVVSFGDPEVYILDAQKRTIVKKRLVKEIYENSVSRANEIATYTYTYTPTGKVDTIKYNGYGKLRIETFAYNVKDELISVTKGGGSTWEIFTQKNDTLIHVGSDTLILNAKKQLVYRKLRSYNNPTKYEYDRYGNLITIVDGYESGSFHFTYDDKYSHFYNLGLPSWYLAYVESDLTFGTGEYVQTGQNNITKIESDSWSVDISYDYDKDGYPVVQYYEYEYEGQKHKNKELIYEVIK